MGLFRRHDPRDGENMLEVLSARIREAEARLEDRRRWLEEQQAINEYCLENGIGRDDSPCIPCYGTGQVEENCGWCDGRGYRDVWGHDELCISCAGSGEESTTCSYCGGRGRDD